MTPATAAPAVVIGPEPFGVFWADALPIITRHWREISAWPDIPLSVDVEKYLAVERDGKLRLVTAREDGVLVGYALFIVSPHGHYQGSLQALQDVFYVDPSRRGYRLGLKLLKASEALLKAEGVQVVHHHVKCAHPALGRLLELRGYDWVERIYSKRLDRG